MAQEPKNKTDKDKKLLLWSAVTFFIVLIFALWLTNLSSILGSSTINEQESDHSFSWQAISDKFSQTWSDLKKEIDHGKETLPDEYNPNIFSSEVSTSSVPLSESSKAEQEFEQLKTDLQDLEEIFDEAKKEGCPEWINCMPQIGQEVTCQIPQGCEGITQIAY